MEESKKTPGWLRGLTLGTLVLTWLLILLGGVVHGTGSSLACPDWPTCHGSFFPEMVGGVLIEHSHRVVAATVGLLVIVLCVGFGLKNLRRPFLWSLLALGIVIFQGVLGGITVIFHLPPEVSTAHLATSMIFLAVMVKLGFLAFQNPSVNSSPTAREKGSGLSLLVLIVLYSQIVLGAAVRHWGAGLACVEIPFCGGLWPSEAPFLVQLQMAHRWWGIVVAGLLLYQGVYLWKQQGFRNRVGILASTMILLVGLQITLGFLTVMTALELLPVTGHLGVGALLWVNQVAIYLFLRPHTQRNFSMESAKPSSSPQMAEA